MSHYTIHSIAIDDGMKLLRDLFPEAVANSMNFVLFSTSGVHGSYLTIEDNESEKVFGERRLTFLVVHPRLVCLKYGNCFPITDDDFAFLKKLRASSWEAVQSIGRGT